MTVPMNKLIIAIVVGVIIVLALGYVFMGNAGNGHGDEVAVVKETVKEPAPETKKTNSPDKGKKSGYPEAPDFTLNNLKSESISLSDYKGKVIFVNFWATWCPPCRAEIPYFIDLYSKYESKGFVVLGIALDPREFSKVPGFVDQMGINYPVLLDQKGVSNLYGGIESIPTTFVVDRDGKVVEMIIGSRPKEVFESIIQSHL